MPGVGSLLAEAALKSELEAANAQLQSVKRELSARTDNLIKAQKGFESCLQVEANKLMEQTKTKRKDYP